MVQKRVRKTAIGIGLTGLVIVGVIIAAQRFGIGGRIVEGGLNLGRTIGGTVTAIPRGILEGGAAGAGNLVDELVKVSENAQRAVNAGKLFVEDAVDTAGNSGTSRGTSTLNSNRFNLDNIFSEESIRNRVTNAIRANNPTVSVTLPGTQRDTSPGGFGGFGNPQAQEEALQRAIRESRENNPEFFV